MIAYLDCSTGVSGDKLLGAVIDAGTELGALTPESVSAVISRVAPEVQLRADVVLSRGVRAIDVAIEAGRAPALRRWSQIQRLLDEADIPEAVRARSLEVLSRLAEAEARVHGVAVSDVHFHEIGALDTIADVVGVCTGIELLGIEQLVASPVATGWGVVATEHGVLPVPAPATEQLLIGIPTLPGPGPLDGTAPGELTTPTGAALVTALAARFGPPPRMIRRASGYGAGDRDIGHPNVCRLTLGAPLSASSEGALGAVCADQVVVLETNLDHLSPEAVGHAVEELMRAGALDVWQTPIVMKKQRLATMLSVLAPLELADALIESMMSLTGTLGVRRFPVSRTVAAREHLTIDSPHGPVRVKRSGSSLRPEHDDIVRIARRTGSPYEAVRAELTRLAEEQLLEDR